jgi:hypothetical protein
MPPGSEVYRWGCLQWHDDHTKFHEILPPSTKVIRDILTCKDKIRKRGFIRKTHLIDIFSPPTKNVLGSFYGNEWPTCNAALTTATHCKVVRKYPSDLFRSTNYVIKQGTNRM